MLKQTFFGMVLALAAVAAVPGASHAQLGGGRSPAGGAGEEAGRARAYTIGGVTVSGAQYLDEDLLLAVAGLTPGSKVRVPGDDAIARAIRNLWKQELFADVQIQITKIVDDRVFFNIAVEERPRLRRYNIRGVRKSEAEELRQRTGLQADRVVTEAAKKEASERIRKYYLDKGYAQTRVTSFERLDTTATNRVILTFDVVKGPKSRVNQVTIAGNTAAPDARLKRGMKGTKEMGRLSLYPADDRAVYEQNDRSFGQYLRDGGFLSLSETLDALNPYFRYNFFAGAKFNPAKFEDDKESIVGYYNSLGYRDAAVVRDTVYGVENGNLNVELQVDEGRRYYFGDITFKGNTKYSDETLRRIVGIRRGEIFNQDLLDRRIGRQLTEGAEDISSLYMDDGYLFFNIEPVETRIVGDTIDFELRITEGQQATIRNVTIAGNDRTNEHVIRRELYTLPGNKFSRSDIVRSVRQIANLGFFDPEKTNPQPMPNPADGTVDIEYNVVEKSSDQLQLSAGFGGGVRFYGNVGIQFNNFSLRNIFKPRMWDPLPIGDGQKFSVNYQSNGITFNSLNASFTEPWLGGRKPNALTTSVVYTRLSGNSQDPGSSYLRQVGGGVSLSKRLKWPDDNFVLTLGINYQNYQLKNYNLIAGFNNGTSDNLFFRATIARYSIDQPLYPRSGSNISFSFQATPPWSSLGFNSFDPEIVSSRYRLIEYHKYRFTADWYKQIAGNLVFRFATKYGFLGFYNPAIGQSPFERFQIGGDGLQQGAFFVGRDVIAHRGYDVYTDPLVGGQATFAIFNKYQAELRYPISLAPTSTIYALAFTDAANGWNSFREYNPLKLYRSAGLGVRVFLPMFGMLGLDYGYRFDPNGPTGAENVKGFRNNTRFTFMLGMEPD